VVVAEEATQTQAVLVALVVVGEVLQDMHPLVEVLLLHNQLQVVSLHMEPLALVVLVTAEVVEVVLVKQDQLVLLVEVVMVVMGKHFPIFLRQTLPQEFLLLVHLGLMQFYLMATMEVEAEVQTTIPLLVFLKEVLVEVLMVLGPATLDRMGEMELMAPEAVAGEEITQHRLKMQDLEEMVLLS
tara:strand:- start:760 stop:1311 length:552 start_codon:yes stop_codon:yes gene_type:complete